MLPLLPVIAAGSGAFLLYRYIVSKKATAIPHEQNTSSPKGYVGPTIAYPPATTISDPALVKTAIAQFQKAQPIPTEKYYRPVDGDLWAIVLARLSGAPPGKSPSQVGLPTITFADIGKLNGFVTAKDLDAWVKAKKPFHLPATFKDGGARQYANGTIS